METRELLSLRGAAARLGVTPMVVSGWVRAGRLRPAFTSGRALLFLEADVAAFKATWEPGPLAGRVLGPRGGRS